MVYPGHDVRQRFVFAQNMGQMWDQPACKPERSHVDIWVPVLQRHVVVSGSYGVVTVRDVLSIVHAALSIVGQQRQQQLGGMVGGELVQGSLLFSGAAGGWEPATADAVGHAPASSNQDNGENGTSAGWRWGGMALSQYDHNEWILQLH